MKVLSLVLATAMVLPMAHAQTSPTSTAGAAESISQSRGTVVDYSAGASLVVNTGSGEPVHYRFGKTVTYINDEGRSIDPARIKKNMIVRLYYTKEGNDMVIDKLILSD